MKRILKIVAIVVGILAALVILMPTWNSYNPVGPAPWPETPRIQSAMDAMMQHNLLLTVSANDSTTASLGVNTWSAQPTGPGATPLAPLYLRLDTTESYFCWDASGLVYPRSDDPEEAKKPGECPQPSPTPQPS